MGPRRSNPRRSGTVVKKTTRKVVEEKVEIVVDDQPADEVTKKTTEVVVEEEEAEEKTAEEECKRKKTTTEVVVEDRDGERAAAAEPIEVLIKTTTMVPLKSPPAQPQTPASASTKEVRGKKPVVLQKEAEQESGETQEKIEEEAAAAAKEAKGQESETRETEELEEEGGGRGDRPKLGDEGTERPREGGRGRPRGGRRRRRRSGAVDGVGEYKRYVHKVLRQVHPELGVSSMAMSVLDGYIRDMFERIVAEAAKLVAYTGKATLTSREIQGAVRLVLPGELGKHAIAEGSKAVAKYMDADA